MAENGPTRREFDQLDRRVAYIDEHGSRRVGIVEDRVKSLQDDIKTLDVKVARNTQALWGLVIVILMGTISIIVTLVTSAP